jgi:hypothetical protein
MNYASWRNAARSAASLLLDPQNPRIPPSSKSLSQAELLVELALHDDVHELARNIAANGFFPSEPLVAIKENAGLIVVEGNRRLAGCKLLVAPELAPESLRARFKSISASIDPTELRKIPILIAPSREATIPLIIARHTATQIAKWQPAMQAHFYYTLVGQGMSIEDVATKFHLAAAQIKDALISHSLYTMACRLDMPEETGSAVRDPRKFKLTNLTRIFEAPAAREFFGVEFADDGRVVGRIDVAEFRKGFARAVADVATGAADSRTLNTPEEIKQYLAGYGPGEKPDTTKKGDFDSTNFAAPGGRPHAPKPKKARRKQLTATSRGLIPPSVSCNVKSPRVLELFGELRRLSPARFPNACAFAFRCFIELSVYCFLDLKGEIGNMKAEQTAAIAKRNSKIPPGKPGRTLPRDWTPGLGEMVKWIADPKRNVIPAGHVTRALTQAIVDEKDLISLNLLVHNPTYPASERRLRESYARLQEFIKLILT